MAAISAYLAKNLLDHTLKTAAYATPGTMAAALALGAPTSVSMSEVGTASGYTAMTIGFAAAASPAGSASNSAAVTFGPFTTPATISGIFLKDTLLTAGNPLYYGLLATARTLASGDSLVVAAGGLTITLA